MGRRIEFEGATHHVTTRSPSRRLLFVQDADAARYLGLLGDVATACGWVVHTFCLMNNHVHAVVTTPETNLGRGLKIVHEEFARRTNRERGEHGALFGRRFDNKLILSHEHFAASMRYVARNPVAANLVRRAEDWPWSAHCALVGLAAPPPFLDVAKALAPLDLPLADARAAYAGWVPQPDEVVLASLEAQGNAWLTKAIDLHRIPPADVASYLGVSMRTLRRRLDLERGREKSDS